MANNVDFNPGWASDAYRVIEGMRPGKRFTHRLLIGMVGISQGERPQDYDADAMAAIVKADENDLIFVSGVRAPGHRGGHAFIWTRYEDEDDAGT